MSFVNALKSFLDHKFQVKNLGPLKYFLGMEVAHSSTGIFFCQRKYVLELLQDFGILGTKPTTWPMDQNIKLFKDNGDLLLDLIIF